MVWMVLSAALIAMLYGLLAAPLIGLFTNQQVVIDLALEYKIWLIILPLISLWSFLLDGIFIGTTQTKAMRNNMLVSTCLYVLSVWILVPLLGNHGLLLCLSGFMVLRALTLWREYPNILKQFTA